MDLNFTKEEEDFRGMIREWIDQNLPEIFRRGEGDRASVEDRKVWSDRLAENGWLCASWPKEHGGPGWSLAQQYIFGKEASDRGAPGKGFGVTMIGPLLIECGNDAQKARYLPKIAANEEVWCQGYSEPNAGSDLASLGLRAVRDGDEYVLNGQKIWTSYADEADMIFLLARTDLEAKKQEGISFFVASMDTPGIEIRPIKQITDDSHFFETFFTDARIPAENLVGEEHAGWTLGKRLLTYERVSTGDASGYQKTLDRLTELAQSVQMDGAPAVENPGIRQKLTQLHIELDSLRALQFRGLTSLLQGKMPGPESSINKLYGSELFQRMTDLAQEIQGPLAQLWSDPNSDDLEHNWPKTATWSRAYTIFSGTSEVQRNIISERVLGLPRG
ncbi:MAG: acyl-CoA dehydrogenase family protein [Candidatus Hydrogenedentes bacterium]|nr:acyl-CoA dehydrogenase family protein [Candidatus Hydrogenedentota bacterium]